MAGYLDGFREIWAVDFEFCFKQEGDLTQPVCLVAWELKSNRRVRLWRDQFGSSPPYRTGSDSLFIAYLTSAEMSCHLALSWPLPQRILDLYVEFRWLTNGTKPPNGNSLIGALAYFGLDTIGAEEKKEMRELILSGGPWSTQQQIEILNYCESDVRALARLLPRMLPRMDFRRGLYRGRYMAAVACMEAEGIPIDAKTFSRLDRNWTRVQDILIDAYDPDREVFEGRSFREARFCRWLAARSITWPLLDDGTPDLKQKTFEQMVKIYPAVRPIYDIRHALGQMRLNELQVGRDGRNRTLLSPFASRTGRNQPSSKKFIFGPSVWLRSLIKPEAGQTLAYIDWEQQEFGIAAVLSDDPNMLKAYCSGDPYLSFAIQAGALPSSATKKGNEEVRDLFKQCCLGVNYGMQERSLAFRIHQTPIVARGLLEMHRDTFRQFWCWSDAAADFGALLGWQPTVFGWVNRVFPEQNPRSLRNFPMQANGAEMLRLACCLGVERNVRICAPVHDAVLICAPKTELESAVQTMRGAMAEASRVVLKGFELRTEVKRVLYPRRYSDKRGIDTFRKIMQLL